MHQQRSDEWYRARAGKVTASRLCDVMAKTKSGYSAARKNYMMELLCQRLGGGIPEKFVSAPMQRGIDLEPIARGVYEAVRGELVDETGLVMHPSVKDFGASPDGLVGDDGLLEIKCPNTSTHVDFLRTKKPKREYVLQMHGQMLCTGRSWCDFLSYDDRLPGLEFAMVTVHRDEAMAKSIIEEVEIFLNELDREVASMEKMRRAA